MAELLIKNGLVIDGGGKPGFRGDVAVAGGRIVKIGKCGENAARVIDASGLVVAPGFIDPHTHYDAQICWDRHITPSVWHGVTTVVTGNCGVGLAPCRPHAREIATWDLVTVEGIPFEVLKQGVTWDWESFPDYMNAAARRGSAINLALSAPLTPFRHYVMGEASMERAANPEETARIRALIREAVQAGAFGFSTTLFPGHIGYQGRPLACRQASLDELRVYAGVLKELGKGAIELSLTKTPGVVTDAEYELLDMLLTESGRPVTWLAMAAWPDRPDEAERTLKRLEPLIRRGGIPQVTCRPFEALINLRSPMLMADMACLKPVFNRSLAEQIQVYRDRAFRQGFREEIKQPRVFSHSFDKIEVWEVGNAALKQFERTAVAKIAGDQGKDLIDALFDLAVADELKTEFLGEIYWEEGVRRLMTDSRTMIGVSDAGAHVDMLCDAGYCTFLLGNWVREKNAITLEHAVKRLTSEVADLWNIKGRGRLAEGAAADIVIFDPDTVGSAARAKSVKDLPGGGHRLVVEAQGVRFTIVNGEVVCEDGRISGVLPGQVLRS